MYQTIGEEVSVAGAFAHSTFKPVKFQWQAKIYPVEEITLVNDIKDGGVRKRYYSVVSQGNLYRLCFNRETEQWLLEEVWYEG